MLQTIKSELAKVASPQKAKDLMRFFKTGKGEYGEGDIFIGVTMPQQRAIAKQYFKTISLEDTKELLNSKIHEERMLSLILLNMKYPKVSEKEQKDIYEFYIKSIKKHINNWDLVDVTVIGIVGKYLFDKERSILYKLAKSDNLWEKRVSIMGTFYFIRNKDYPDALAIAKILLNDKHDLIHKAVGWMLREIGKRDLAIEEIFLQEHYKKMPRTMLRYAIEKFPEAKRLAYLKGTI